MKPKGFPYKFVKKKHIAQLKEQYNAIAAEIEYATEFVKGVEKGELDTDYSARELNSQLIEALLSMREQLQKIADEEKERNWSTEGLAKFVDILRNNTNLNELGSLIISHVVKYVGANQGGLFILGEESDEQEQYLEMLACYAYERKKHQQKKVGIGEGLLGQAFLEKETIYLIDIPEDYVSITSGLGDANPSSLLIIPLKVNGKVYGVMELASFNKFEPFEIVFLEKLGENIASTLSTVKINERTQSLLEESRLQAEQMRSQEEEMRQNMEELQATQEGMRRKQQETEAAFQKANEQAQALVAKENALNDSHIMLQAVIDNMPGGVFWKDKDLNYLGCNKLFSDLAALPSPSDIVGKSDFDLPWVNEAEAFRLDDAKVFQSGEAKLDFEEQQTQKDGSILWVRTSKIPLKNEVGEVFSVLGSFRDITKIKKQELEFKEKVEKVQSLEDEIQQLKQQIQEKEAENATLQKKLVK